MKKFSILENEKQEKLPTKNMRSSNFELLRIICMLLIIAHHFSVHSAFSSNTSIINLALIKFLKIGGKIGVNIYVLISGYFMINSHFKLKKLLKLICETAFYSIIIYLSFCIFKKETLSFSKLWLYTFPVYGKLNWFMTYFILLYIFSPFINKCLKNCSTKEHLSLICILLASQLIIPNHANYSPIIFSELIWFITLYIIAAFIRLHPSDMLDLNIFMGYIAIGSFILIATTTVFCNMSFYSMTNIVCLVCSFSIFCVFKNLKIKNSKFINTISSATLGVYLIHDNRLVRRQLWNKLLQTPKHALSSNFYLYSFVSILLVFVACRIIDLIRKYFVYLCSKIKFKTKNLNNTKELSTH